MKKSLNIAIFGLSLKVLNELKNQILSSLPHHVEVNWVNIADKNIDLLLVHDAFFESTSIQKVIAQIQLQYLRLIKLPEQSGMIINDTLAYPIHQPQHLRQWLADKFFNYVMDYSIEQENKKNVANNPTQVIAQCLNSRNGFIRLFDYWGFLALVDTMTERVWVNPKHPASCFDQSLNHTYATNQFVQETIKTIPAQDLKSWLWKMAMQSQSIKLEPFSSEKYFKLTTWPKFENHYERRQLIKIATCFAQGAQIQSVTSHLNLSKTQVKQFVYVAKILNLGTWIEEKDAKFKPISTESNSVQMGKVQSFFKKLRKKLGL